MAKEPVGSGIAFGGFRVPPSLAHFRGVGDSGAGWIPLATTDSPGFWAPRAQLLPTLWFIAQHSAVFPLGLQSSPILDAFAGGEGVVLLFLSTTPRVWVRPRAPPRRFGA